MRSRLNDDFSNQMCRVENMLDERTKRYMDSPQKSLTNLNKLIYVYSASRSKIVERKSIEKNFN